MCLMVTLMTTTKMEKIKRFAVQAEVDPGFCLGRGAGHRSAQGGATLRIKKENISFGQIGR